MRIWKFADPADYRFARASRRGSWQPSFDLSTCPECGAARQKRAQPLIMEWEPGSDVVGDFTWPGFGNEVVATQIVCDALSERFSGFRSGAVEFFQEPNLNPAEGTEPRVRLPYEGPAICELWITASVNLDRDRSTVRRRRPKCTTCGSERFALEGTESWQSRWDAASGEVVRTHLPRVPYQGAYVAERHLHGASVFRFQELPGWVVCTDSVRDFVLETGFTNVSFLEMGESL